MDPPVTLVDAAVVTDDPETTISLTGDAADTAGDPRITVALTDDVADTVGNPETTFAHTGVAANTDGPTTNIALMLELSPCTHVP